MTYYSVCSRFDIGLAVFFALFLVDLMITARGGHRAGGNPCLYSLFSFLLLSLIGIGMARANPSGAKAFLPGHAIFGIIAGFAATVLVAAGSVALLFLPVLQRTADVGYRAVETGGRFIAPLVVSVLRFLFGPRNMRADPTSPSAGGTEAFGHTFVATTWWGQVVEEIMRWGMEALAILLLLIGAGSLVFFVVKWLAAQSGSGEKRLKRDEQISWWSRFRLVLIALVTGVLRLLAGYSSAAHLYRALQSWGRRSGIPLRTTDTPAEFGTHLSRCHPMLTPDIERIVDAFNRQTYGNVFVTGIELADARSSLRSLHSPRHWARRLRTRFTKP